MRPLRVVGLDLAPAASGIARTHDSLGERRLAVSTVTASLRKLHEQVDVMEMAVRRACGSAVGEDPLGGHRPDLVVVEGTFSRPGASDYPLHAVRALPLQWLYRQRIPYVEVSPATLKVWATGSGATRGENKITKDKVRAAIVATYGGLLHINPRDDDACDAVALLTMGLAAYGQALVSLPAQKTRALSELKWPKLEEATR